jgi:hypothetical protein
MHIYETSYRPAPHIVWYRAVIWCHRACRVMSWGQSHFLVSQQVQVQTKQVRRRCKQGQRHQMQIPLSLACSQSLKDRKNTCNSGQGRHRLGILAVTKRDSKDLFDCFSTAQLVCPAENMFVFPGVTGNE